MTPVDDDRELDRDTDLDSDRDGDLGRRGTENTVQGKSDELLGKAQRGLGDMTDNDSLEAKGRIRELKGKAQQDVGRADRDADDALDHRDADDALDDRGL